MAAPGEVVAMRRAVRLAAHGPVRGANPRVGCVVLDRSGRVAGEGWHAGAGTAHAEVEALRAAGRRARGGTAVVSLEPCNHTGRTGPCVEALLQAGIARVVIASADPNPRAAGGAARLRAAGVEVEEGVLAPESDRLNRRWLFAVSHGRPFVTWKFAATLDGRSAAADGSSRWITGSRARADVHALRAEADAVVVGTGTVLADDPRLTVRDGAGRPAGEQPLRVVVGERDLPAQARVLDATAPSVHLRTRNPLTALAELSRREVRHAWLEGGPTLAAAFWRAGLIDEVIAYLAPALLGAGPNAVGDLGVLGIDGAARLRLTDVTRIGDDLRLTLTRSTDRSPDRSPGRGSDRDSDRGQGPVPGTAAVRLPGGLVPGLVPGPSGEHVPVLGPSGEHVPVLGPSGEHVPAPGPALEHVPAPGPFPGPCVEHTPLFGKD